MTLNTMELKQLIQVTGQVSVPVASKDAMVLGQLINKMSLMIEELESNNPKKIVKPVKPKKLKKTT